MRIVTTENYYDNIIRDENQHDLTFDELTELFTKHTITDDKDGMMFVAAEFLTSKDVYRPAMRKIKVNGEWTGDYENKSDKHGNPQVGRYGDNVIAYHALVLDYDGEGTDLENIFNRFHDFNHWCYTSYNHNYDKVAGVIDKNIQKCRVILPFKTPCPQQEWQLRRDAMVEFAGAGIDATTCSIGRAFYLPSVDKSRQHLAVGWANLSENNYTLEWDVFARREPTIYRGSTEYNGERDANADRVFQVLSTGSGLRYADGLQLAMFCKTYGMSEFEFNQLIACMSDHDSSLRRAEVQRMLWQEGHDTHYKMSRRDELIRRWNCNKTMWNDINQIRLSRITKPNYNSVV